VGPVPRSHRGVADVVVQNGGKRFAQGGRLGILLGGLPRRSDRLDRLYPFDRSDFFDCRSCLGCLLCLGRLRLDWLLLGDP